MNKSSFELNRLDHFALTVRDIEATCAFYEKVLGMARVRFSEDRIALRFGRQKININPSRSELVRKAAVPIPGSAEFCLVSARPLDEFIQHLQGCGVDIEYGPVETAGAEGTIRSISFRDPDGNLIEVANYL
jgi:catechol 2,3-dioxygenase-like lactoylglutathione lyase family enzyme